MSEGTVEFRGTINLVEFGAAQRALMPVWLRSYVVAPFCFIFFVSTGVGWHELLRNPAAAAPDFVFAALVLLASAAITWYGRRRAWRVNADLHGEVHGSLGASGLEWKTATTTSNFPWEKLMKFKVVNDLALLYYTPRCAFYFPRRFFSSSQAWTSFLGTLASRLPRSL